MLAQNTTTQETKCYHCGDDLPGTPYRVADKQFCCLGCQGVYQILSSHNLTDYYAYNDVPGQTQKHQAKHFEYLDESTITAKLVDYQDENITVITFYIPAIHCSSCIWLLEHLHKINPAIRQSRIDFLKKQVLVTFKNREISLREVVELLAIIGYEPLISLQDVVKEQKKDLSERSLIRKIAVAGFCFGNVMLLSFPDYFGIGAIERQFSTFFGWLNLVFALPMVFYSGKGYFVSAWANLRKGILNLDFPLALGIAVMFIRSVYEIVSGTGAGFVDTLCGLVFFLLIGKWMQHHTYHHLSFERDYRSYFPVAVTLIKDGAEKPIPLNELAIGNRMLIRSNEIIPADAILLKGEAEIDFSFVTGESKPVRKVLGEVIYAGGRQLGGALEMEVVKPISQSYLTQLWNNETFNGKKDHIRTFSDIASRYFSIVLLAVAVGAAFFWIGQHNQSKALASFTAVLIIACPCALALSSPFTLAAVLSIFDKNKFYLKNTAVVEELARIDTYVFDKTGTITNPDSADFIFEGGISDYERQLVNDLARNSGHPLSRELVTWLGRPTKFTVDKYKEKVGRGITGLVDEREVRLGSASFLGISTSVKPKQGATVHILIDNEYLGCFSSRQQWRKGFKELIFKLGKTADLHLLSGDQDQDKHILIPFFPRSQQMHFKQSPQNKLDYIFDLQDAGRKVLMFGDGLNDAGALKQSDLGIAVTDDINNFSPGCDAILDGKSFQQIPNFIQQAKDAVKVIHISFAISLTYNIVGLYFAVQGILSPLIAAILMPVSTVTVIIFTSVAARFFARKNKLL
ncbi:Cu(I)-translocating P-type ATPase [Pedobacter sp. BAL39]|uniref:heavy metal translocating P-type ATPase n=1 Tax=Pedobacter sp. BAL39 TaxID=391596 RepID=UPI0001559F10|nr:heavy metal translocating P-type ATPase metal-binding domain-containing protein [Pedobacter sp. BAL39]EDM36788.1 Cu(I)-translocating P-type ATPase [Pedobacter sp. BAL39]